MEWNCKCYPFKAFAYIDWSKFMYFLTLAHCLMHCHLIKVPRVNISRHEVSWDKDPLEYISQILTAELFMLWNGSGSNAKANFHLFIYSQGLLLPFSLMKSHERESTFHNTWVADLEWIRVKLKSQPSFLFFSQGLLLPPWSPKRAGPGYKK